MTTTFDPVQYKTSTLAQWEQAAEAWDRWDPTLRDWLGGATERMLDAAGVTTGAQVLDVAAGSGGQSLDAARRVGPDGHVLATDISPTILSYAARAAEQAGLSNLEVRAQDGERLDVAPGAFDAVICRLGLIYFPDQQAALRGMYRALRPGGRLAAVVYSTADRNGFFAVPVSIIRRRAQLPAPLPGQPGPFSLGAAGVLEQALTTAGFSAVTVQAVPAPLRLGSADDCVRFERESFGALHQMLGGLPAADQADVWAEITRELRRFETADGDGPGFEGPCELLVAAGTR